MDGDTTKLESSLGKVNSSIKSTESALRDVNKLLKLDPTNTTLLSQKYNLLQTEITDTKTKLAALKEADKQAKAQLEAGTLGQEKYDALQREIIETEEKLKSLENTVGSGSAKLAEISAKTGEFGEKATAAGQKLKPLSMAAMAIGTAAVKTAADFETGMSKVQAITQGTGEDLEALREKALQLGADTAFSASEVSAAMSEMAKAGWTTQDILDGMSGVLDAAAASGEELSTVSTILADAITGFGLSAADSTRVADLLTQAANAGTIDIADLGETFSYVAPVATAMGYSIEDVTTAIAAMSDSGIKGSQAGTVLRTMLTNMVNPTENMAVAMEELGVKLYDNEGNMYSLKDIVGQLQSGLGNLGASSEEFTTQLSQLDAAFADGTISQDEYEASVTELSSSLLGAEEAEKAKYAAMLAGKTGMSGLLALTNKTAEEYDSLSQSMYDCTGVAQETAEVMQDNLKGKLEQLGGAVETFAIRLGDILIPMVTAVVEKLTVFADWLGNLSPGMQKVIGTILMIVAAAWPLLAMIGRMATGISAITGLLSKAKNLNKLIGIIGGIKKAVIGLFSIISANWIILTIGAIIAVIVLLYNKCEWFRDAVNAIWDGIKAAFSAVVEWFKTLPETFSAIWEGIKDGAANIWNSIKDFFVGLWEGIKGVFTGVLTAISSFVSGAWSGMLTVITTVINAIKMVITMVWNAIKTTVTTVINTIKAVISTVWNGIKTTITTIVNGIKNTAVNAFNGLLNGIKSILSGLTSAVSNGFQGAINFITSLPKKALQWGKDFIQGLINGIKNMIGKVTNAVKEVASKITSFLHFTRPDEGPLREYETWMPDFMEGLAKGIRGNMGIVESAVSKLADSMSTNLTGNMEVVAATSGGAVSVNNSVTVQVGNRQFEGYIVDTVNDNANTTRSSLSKLKGR